MTSSHAPAWSARSGSSYAALIGVQSVGVQGDERTYAYPIVVRAVTSEDAMTADWARIPHDVLEKISNRITGGGAAA